MFERVCAAGCGYEVSSLSACTSSAASRSFPTTCQRCGADLVSPPVDDVVAVDAEISSEIREFAAENGFDPVKVAERRGELEVT